MYVYNYKPVKWIICTKRYICNLWLLVFEISVLIQCMVNHHSTLECKGRLASLLY